MIAKALKRLQPNANWNLNGETYEGLEWFSEDIPKPTQQEVDAAIIEIQQEYEATQYQRDRAGRYPNILDQLDMLWHAIDTNSLNKTSDFYTAIKAVKDAYPKSGE